MVEDDLPQIPTPIPIRDATGLSKLLRRHILDRRLRDRLLRLIILIRVIRGRGLDPVGVGDIRVRVSRLRIKNASGIVGDVVGCAGLRVLGAVVLKKRGKEDREVEVGVRIRRRRWGV